MPDSSNNPSAYARKPRLLQLSDDDLRALGEIAAQWSLASAILEILLVIISSSNPQQAPPISKRLISFDTRADACKKLLKTYFDGFPLHKEIGLALMSRGKELSTERNIALHWPASRAPGKLTLQFADMNLWGQIVTQRHWTTDKLLALADQISDWTTDIAQFKMRLIFDGPLASRTTWHGPKSDMGTLRSENFRTIRKASPPAKQQTRQPPPQSS